MKWIRYDIHTLTTATDVISGELSELGISGVEISDNLAPENEILGGNIVDIVPEMPEDDGTAIVSFYINMDDEDKDKTISKISTMLEELKTFMDIGSGNITTDETEDIDWIDNWKKYWHAFKINDLVIKPTWEEITEDMKSDKVISLDPGRAFGTGAHESTSLVIQAIQKYLKDGDTVLDVGCGSGILSIVSIKYGASKVKGIDLDPMAIDASRENVATNNLVDRNVEFEVGDIISDTSFRKLIGQSDVVCANILPEVLVPLSVNIDECVKNNGILIYSGIMEFKLIEVEEALLKNGHFEIIDRFESGDWRSVVAVKRD